MSLIRYYRSKPLHIEGVQLTADNFALVAQWVEITSKHPVTVNVAPDARSITFTTFDDDTRRAGIGDYVTCDQDGDFDSYDAEVFGYMYDEVEYPPSDDAELDSPVSTAIFG